MAVFTFSNGVVKSGANVVGSVSAATLNERVIKADAHVAGASLSQSVPGRMEADGSVTCFLDDDDTDGQNSLAPGLTIDLTLLGEGEGSGKISRNIPTAVIQEQAETYQVDTTTVVVFTFWVNGAVDRSAVTP